MFSANGRGAKLLEDFVRRLRFFVQPNSAVTLRRVWKAYVEAARPSPKPLPAVALVRRVTSCDTRGEGSPAVVLIVASDARCVTRARAVGFMLHPRAVAFRRINQASLGEVKAVGEFARYAWLDEIGAP
jgi:hypothetical protein